MMNSIKLIVFLGLFIASSAINAQDRKIQRAKKKFEAYQFMDAITNYQELLTEGYSEEEIYKGLGNANYLNAKYKDAAQWYAKLVDLKGDEIEKEYLYKYAQSLKSTGDYDKASLIMERFKMTEPNDNRVNLFTNQKDYLKEIEKNSGNYTISTLTINSPVSEFSPSFYKEKIVFATAKDTGVTSKNIHQWNKGAFLNLYSATVDEAGFLSTVEKFATTLNSKAHESSAAFTRDGKTVYFTRNNVNNNRFKRDEKGISRLKIFKAELLEGQWTNITELPFNADNYSVAHPALSTDEKTLYFSSDMPGSIGASDIFSVAINDDGSYGKPKNLGNTINTESRETFPFVLENILFFASDGHPGLGGLDLFATKLDGSSSKVLNLGKPINGQQDDFSLIINSSGKGYFASNRDGGLGQDDIYSFQENKPLGFDCFVQLNGTVLDAETKQPISEAEISVVDSSGSSIKTVLQNLNEEFNMELDCNAENLSLVVKKEAYQSTIIAVDSIAKQSHKVEVLLTKDTPQLANNLSGDFTPEVGSDLVAVLELNPILFDLNSSEIRKDAALVLDKAADFLKKNTALKVEVKAHSDAKGSKNYNQKLSQLRAKSTFDYLVASGVNSNTITFKGYGENNLLNDCENWAKCTDFENEKNRRSELIFRHTAE